VRRLALAVAGALGQQPEDVLERATGLRRLARGAGQVGERRER
jgi:hypothetical protein